MSIDPIIKKLADYTLNNHVPWETISIHSSVHKLDGIECTAVITEVPDKNNITVYVGYIESVVIGEKDFGLFYSYDKNQDFDKWIPLNIDMNTDTKHYLWRSVLYSGRSWIKDEEMVKILDIK